MKKFINSVETMLSESLDGFAAVHADIVALGAERKFVRRSAPNLQKVALVSGGGSGHEPLHAGFVGRGMLDAACPGQIFTSPTPDQIVDAATAVGEHETQRRSFPGIRGQYGTRGWELVRCAWYSATRAMMTAGEPGSSASSTWATATSPSSRRFRRLVR